VNNKGLDYAIVALTPRSLSGASLDQFQYLPLIAAKGKIRKGDPVNIIQHPEGRPKQYATVNNRLLDLSDAARRDRYFRRCKGRCAQAVDRLKSKFSLRVNCVRRPER
jgi:hypothetical protein